MKKIYVFFAGTLLFSSPVFAQKLGSFSNPNMSGTAGAFSVYSPEDIERLDSAGHDVSLAVEPGTSTRTPKRRRRPNAWVLSGGVLSTQEEKDLYAEQDAFMQEREAKKKIPSASRQNQNIKRTSNDNTVPKTGNSTARNLLEERTFEMDSSERTGQNSSTNSVVSNEITSNENVNVNVNAQNSGETNTNNSQINSIDEDTLVCRKYEKCAICERKKPFWSGRECVNSRTIKKMKKREEARAERNGNSNGNGQGNAVVSQNGGAVSSDLTGTQGQSTTTVQETGSGTTQTDPTLNPDGTKKSKKQLKRDRQKTRTKKSKKE